MTGDTSPYPTVVDVQKMSQSAFAKCITVFWGTGLPYKVQFFAASCWHPAWTVEGKEHAENSATRYLIWTQGVRWTQEVRWTQGVLDGRCDSDGRMHLDARRESRWTQGV